MGSIATTHETGIKSYPEQSKECQGRGISQGEWSDKGVKVFNRWNSLRMGLRDIRRKI